MKTIANARPLLMNSAEAPGNSGLIAGACDLIQRTALRAAAAISLPILLLAAPSFSQPPPRLGNFGVSFSDVSSVTMRRLGQLQAAIAAGQPILIVEAPSTQRAQVSQLNWPDPLPPGVEPLPTELDRIRLVNVESSVRSAAEKVMGDCMKLALVAEARPEKYRLSLLLALYRDHSDFYQSGSNGRDWTFVIDENMVSCELKRVG